MITTMSSKFSIEQETHKTEYISAPMVSKFLFLKFWFQLNELTIPLNELNT